MRRDAFLKSLAVLAAAGTLPFAARAAANIKMMIPANPGGGWDTTGRALGKAIRSALTTRAVLPVRWAWPSSSTAARPTRTPSW
jgi:putative tricarboxylic transport membrane protein